VRNDGLSNVLPQKRHRAVGKETGLTNLTILSDSITLYVNASVASFDKLYLSPKKYKITSVRFFYSLTITTNYYEFSTTMF